MVRLEAARAQSFAALSVFGPDRKLFAGREAYVVFQ